MKRLHMAEESICIRWIPTWVDQKMAPSLLTFVALSSILFLGLQILHHRAKQYHRLSHVPGPWIAGIFPRLWTIISTARNTLHLDHAAVLKKYGRWCHTSNVSSY